MDIDAAQYFAMSREMMESGNYLQLYERGKDYLDKPPLLFWLSSLSLKLFGVSNFAYKLPAVLCIILGIYATYRFALEWYDKQRAVIAALILCSTQAFLLMTNDVRTDGILTSLIICAVWQISVFIKKGKLTNLVFGSVALAFAMMTKGPIAMIILIFAIGGDLVLKRNWKIIFNPRWLLMLLIIVVLLLPMCYGLYTQYDLHPEKETYGLKGPSGIKFFFWTQSFGRITGDIYWNNDLGYFFFCHSILWDFQPWILFFIPALFILAGKLIRSKFRVISSEEYITFCGFVLSFLALSQSSYKLPHYIFPLFPFAAIITSDFIVGLAKQNEKVFRVLTNIQFGILHLFFIAAVLCFFFIFPPVSFMLPLSIGLLFVLYWYLFKRVNNKIDKLMLSTLIACFAFGLLMSTCFYPALLSYQAEGQAGKEITKRNTPKDMFYCYRAFSQSLDVYAQRIVPSATTDSLEGFKRGTLLFTDQQDWENIKHNTHLHYKIIKIYDSFSVSELNVTFLNKNTRQSILTKKYLLEKY